MTSLIVQTVNDIYFSLMQMSRQSPAIAGAASLWGLGLQGLDLWTVNSGVTFAQVQAEVTANRDNPETVLRKFATQQVGLEMKPKKRLANPFGEVHGEAQAKVLADIHASFWIRYKEWPYDTWHPVQEILLLLSQSIHEN